MPEKPKLPFPLWTLMLDIVGTILLAAGLFGLLAGDLPSVEALNLAPLAIPLIIFGVLLMAPLVVFAIKGAAARR